MKHLGISGGGTKIAGLFGAAEAILYERGYRPDIISGISAGAILCLPLALGKRDEIRELALNFTLDTFFSDSPVKANGSLRVWNAIQKILGKKYYLGEQQNLEKVLREVVSRKEFEDYTRNPSLPACVVGSVDFYTGKRLYVNLKTVSYEDFPRFVNASASIPLFTPGIVINTPVTDFEGRSIDEKLLLFDGGVRDHSPSNKILSSDDPAFQITETCTIFSRPENVRDVLSSTPFEAKNLLTILERYTDITNVEISKNDEEREKELIERKGIVDHGTFYLPTIMHSFYDVDKTRLRELYEKSKQAVNDQTWKD